MRKKSIGLIIGLMACALLGVMGMQLYFLVQTYDMQSKLFDRSIDDALNNVVAKVTKREALNFAHSRLIDSEKKSNKNLDITKPQWPSPAKQRQNRRDSLKKLKARLAEELIYDSKQIKVHIETFVDQYGNFSQRGYSELVNAPGNANKVLPQYDTVQISYIDPQFGPQVISDTRENPLWRKQQEHNQRLKQYRSVKRMLDRDSVEELGKTNSHEVFDNIADEYQKMNEPLRKRLDLLMIDSLLRFEFHNHGIYLPFSYMVSNANNDSLIYSKAMDTRGEKPVFNTNDTFYQTPIFTKDVINDPGMLRVAFPQKRTLILNRMAFSMATSGGLLMVLVFCFGYTIFSILRQKKISEMKTDFINNMTHEFKTPVSTIMIASEALKDDEMATDKDRITRLANIIYEENARLGSHIERVLNIARIEKNDFKLDIKPVDVHETITEVLDSMALKLQKYDAQTTLNLDAQHVTIEADELHFSNVLYNLVDNAIKYSNGAPQITVSTHNVKNTLVITVADKGIGMTREQQTRIFEQFYRIPTGNLHNVKGFGLGLSYVNTIVKRLDGTISVRSEKDKGSEFELRFPLV